MAAVFEVGIRKTGLGVMIISHRKGDILHSYFLQNRAHNNMLTYIYSFQEEGELQHNKNTCLFTQKPPLLFKI